MRFKHVIGAVVAAYFGALSGSAGAAPLTNGGFESGDFTGWSVQGYAWLADVVREICAIIDTNPKTSVQSLGAFAFCNFSALLCTFLYFPVPSCTMTHASRGGFGRAHNPKVTGSNPVPATNKSTACSDASRFSFRSVP